jgi:hypothetical protein
MVSPAAKSTRVASESQGKTLPLSRIKEEGFASELIRQRLIVCGSESSAMGTSKRLR